MLVPFNTEPQLINFGAIARDAPPQTKSVTITRGDGDPLKLELVPVKDKTLSATLREIEPGEKYELDVSVQPPWPNDRIRGSVDVKTGLPQAPRQTIRVYGQVDPRLQAKPSRFTLPQDNTSDTDIKVDLLWSGAEAPGKILSAAPTDNALHARVEENEGKQSIVLTVPADYERKRGVALVVKVTTDDPVAPELRVPIIGLAKRPAASPDPAPAPRRPPPTTGARQMPNRPQKPARHPAVAPPSTATSQPAKKAGPDN